MSLNLIVKPELYTNFIALLDNPKISTSALIDILKSAFPNYTSSWETTGSYSAKGESALYFLTRSMVTSPSEQYYPSEVTSIEQVSGKISGQDAVFLKENTKEYFEWLIACGFVDAAYGETSSTGFTAFFSHNPVPKRIKPEPYFASTIKTTIEANNMPEDAGVFEVTLDRSFKYKVVADLEVTLVKSTLEKIANSGAKTLEELKITRKLSYSNYDVSSTSEADCIGVATILKNWLVDSGFPDAKFAVNLGQNGIEYEYTLSCA